MNKADLITEIISENLSAENGDRVLWSRHAVAKLVMERVGRREVEAALRTCALVEDYPTIGRPLPDCLVLCFVAGAPLHVIVAVDETARKIIIVTVYVPSEQRWESDWKTRK